MQIGRWKISKFNIVLTVDFKSNVIISPSSALLNGPKREGRCVMSSSSQTDCDCGGLNVGYVRYCPSQILTASRQVRTLWAAGSDGEAGNYFKFDPVH